MEQLNALWMLLCNALCALCAAPATARMVRTLMRPVRICGARAAVAPSLARSAGGPDGRAAHVGAS